MRATYNILVSTLMRAYVSMDNINVPDHDLSPIKYILDKIREDEIDNSASVPCGVLVISLKNALRSLLDHNVHTIDVEPIQEVLEGWKAKNKDVTVKDGKVFFGKKQVQNLELKEGEEIPRQYVIRVYEEEEDYMEFVTGIDICDNGMLWLGVISPSRRRATFPHTYHEDFESIEYILNKICVETRKREWEIYPEERSNS